MASVVDRSLFRDLADRDPGEVSRRTGALHDPGDGRYQLALWGEEYGVWPGRGEVRQLSRGPAHHPYFEVFIVHHLLHGQLRPPCGTWISENDLPGGSTFFRGPHAIPTSLIGARHRGNLPGFSRRCLSLGGQPLEMADAAFAFTLSATLSVAVLFWDEDADFPAQAKLLFDKSIDGQLPLDIVFALAIEVCNRIGVLPGLGD